MANTKAIEAMSTDNAAANASTDSPYSDYADGLNAALFKNKFRGLKLSAACTIWDLTVGLTTGGTSTAYTGTSKRAIDTYFEGLTQVIVPDANSGADPTFSLNSVGAKPIKTASGGSIGADDLVANVAYTLRYTTQSSGQWRLVAPLSTDITAEIAAAITAALGVNTDVWTGTTTKAVTGGALVAALAKVEVTMDNAMELDLDLGRNFTPDATLNTNSTITFAHARTTVVTFTFTCDGTNRTLTFPSGSVTVDGFSTLTKQFASNQTHQAICYIRDTGVYDWTFRSNIKAAA